MKRRDFIHRAAPAAITLPTILNGFAIKAMTAHPLLNSILEAETITDKVLVLIQLSGGNDGLNTVIPLENYADYLNARSNVAITQNAVLGLTGQNKVGLHPAMTGMQSMYNDGEMNIVQSVGYPNPNLSHFRSTDIWMSGSDSDENIPTGWMGRYLDTQYPGFPVHYPNSEMPDPLALQIGSLTSLTFQGPSMNLGMSISNASSFYNLVNGVQDNVPNTPAGKELAYIRDIARQTNLYNDAITRAYNNVSQQAAYPDNGLAAQLKIVARLVKGGLKTRVYMVSMGGFDTHAAQVNDSDHSKGAHAKLLERLSSAVKAFNDDLKFLQIQDRVIGMTFSEFGRRIKSNASGGTDHGTAAPVLIFGAKVEGGVTGENPDIPVNTTVDDNIAMQYDFRSIYATILEKWFCADATTLQTSLLRNYQELPLIKGQQCRSTPNASNETLVVNYPNPFSDHTTIKFKTYGGHTLIQVIDASGRVIKKLAENDYMPGTYTVEFNGAGLPSGVYYARLQNESVSQVRSMLKLR